MRRRAPRRGAAARLMSMRRYLPWSCAPSDQQASAGGATIGASMTMSDDHDAPSLLRSVGLLADGPVVVGRPVPSRRPGIYLVELTAPVSTAPIDQAAVLAWLERVPSLRLDGEQPTPKALAARLGAFWLPSESVVYVGAATSTIGGRVAALRAHVPGERRPHADGAWLHLLQGLDRMRIWWAESEAPEEYLDAVLGAFSERVVAAERLATPDPTIALPFANTRSPTGGRRSHGLTGYLLGEPVARTATAVRVVDLPPGDADGSRPAARGAGTTRRAPSPARPAARTSRPSRSASTAASRAEPIQLSADGLDRLQTELAELVARRPEVVARIRSARELGDLKENADYHAAREEQSFLEGRIQSLDARLRSAVVVEAPPSGAAAVVRLGSRLTVEIDGDTVAYMIVGTSEANPAAGRLSAASPVGAALLGHSPGEAVEVRTPRGTSTYRIVSID